MDECFSGVGMGYRSGLGQCPWDNEDVLNVGCGIAYTTFCINCSNRNSENEELLMKNMSLKSLIHKQEF